MSTIQTIEGAAIGVGPAWTGLVAAIGETDRLSIGESASALGMGVSTVTYYFATAWQNIGRASVVLSDLMNRVAAVSIPILKAVPSVQVLSYLGIATAGFKLIKESLSLVRQGTFLRLFNPTLSRQEILQQISKLKSTNLQRVLPEWLFEKIKSKGEQTYIAEMAQKIASGDTETCKEASELLNHMQSYARRKTVLHIIQIAAALVTLVGCIAVILACPWAVSLVLMSLSLALALNSFLFNRGYVENNDPEEGFSFRKCLPSKPQFIVNWEHRSQQHKQAVLSLPPRLTLDPSPVSRKYISTYPFSDQKRSLKISL